MSYVLAFLFVAVLVFEYLQTRQYISVIQHLTRVIAELKAFVIGKPTPEPKPYTLAEPPSHPDFGLGKIIDDIERAEDDKEI